MQWPKIRKWRTHSFEDLQSDKYHVTFISMDMKCHHGFRTDNALKHDVLI